METKSDTFNVDNMLYAINNLNTKPDNLSQQDDTETKLLEILKNIDWQRFHNLCLSIGKDLNDPQWRFLKAIFLESAIGKYSNNELTYVGD